jgi:hypothetical protein
LVIAAAASVHISGNFGEMALAIFGFGVSTLLFAGVVGVLPWMIDRHHSRLIQTKLAGSR